MLAIVSAQIPLKMHIGLSTTYDNLSISWILKTNYGSIDSFNDIVIWQHAHTTLPAQNKTYKSTNLMKKHTWGYSDYYQTTNLIF
jgi:hypothetical protein